jgi:Flp pilus assembly pilin Flp
MLRLVTHAQSLLADRRGTVYVEYSSLVLLVAIAAIALLAHIAGAPD